MAGVADGSAGDRRRCLVPWRSLWATDGKVTFEAGGWRTAGPAGGKTKLGDSTPARNSPENCHPHAATEGATCRDQTVTGGPIDASPE